MIDLRDLRDNPDRYRDGARKKNIHADIDRILTLDDRRRSILTSLESFRAQQNKLAKETGPLIGKLSAELKSADPARQPAIEAQLADLRNKPAALKQQIQALEADANSISTDLDRLLLDVPLPPDDDVPVGAGPEQNVELRRWSPPSFDPARPFADQRGFSPKTHVELCRDLNLADFERGVKIAGARSYILTSAGMLLHQAVLRYAFDFMVQQQGFTPVSVPVIVREDSMLGAGFFPAGREQAYHIEETKRGSGHDLFLTGTGEVGLMALHQDEILDEASLPRRYVTLSTCFRREAGAAGKDMAGLFRVHQFDKVEQVVICSPDSDDSRAWHKRMIEYVESILQSLSLPYRLLQCCTGDLGPKNAAMIDIESWCPGRGELDKSGRPLGAFAETHSASRLYDFQCRRLNLRVRGPSTNNKPAPAHSLNNTVIASPRILIPLLEIWQNADGSVTIPPPLRPYMHNAERIA